MEDDSPYEIAIARTGGLASVSEECLSGAIRATLERHHVSRAQISVALVDDDRITQLNEAHLDHQGPTDVLTFDLRDAESGSAAVAGDPIEGEIVVSVDTADREARTRGHELDAELALYVIHGTLHLLGFDDQTTDEAARMHGVEDEILVSLGFGPVYGGTA